jgi:hypothetical protein
MRFRARTIIASLGAFVMLGGAFALTFALSANGPWSARWRGVVGAGVALLIGGLMVFAGFTGRLPDALQRLLDLED